VLCIAARAVHADRHLTDGEALVLDAIGRHWGLGALTATAKRGIAGLPARSGPSRTASVAHHS
jgi:hypothetical protein